MSFEKVKTNKNEAKGYFVKQSYKYDEDDYWDWSVWIDSDDSKKLDNIKSVTYHLHKTFPKPVRIIKDRETNFRLKTSGWGTFTIYIVINLKDNSVVELTHDLILK